MTIADATAPNSIGVPPAARRTVALAVRASLTFALGFVLIIALLSVAAGGAGFFLRTAEALPFGLDVPDEVELGSLEERSIVYARDGSILAVLHDEHHRRQVTLDEVPDHAVHAVLAAEDRRFYDHEGYDPAAIGRALIANLQARGVEQGGSTITQQLAKQNFVGADRTMQRKVDELAHAIALEREFDKDALIERYLNQVYFGNGAYGIATAAWEYFRAGPGELEPAEAALLAAVIRSPSALDPRRNEERVRDRRDWVLAGMVEEGWLDADEAAAAQETDIDLAPPLQPEVREPYVVEAVKRAFLDDPTFGETRQERIDRLFSGGVRIHTTLDPELQALASNVVEAHAAELDGPTAALAAVHPSSGEVLALYGGADFAEEQFDLATQGRRQPGSAFKPFVLAAALEDGVPLRQRLEGDSGATFDVPGWTEADDGVRNFGGSNHGRIDLREALVRSVNTAFADLIMDVGVERVMQFTERLGVDADRAFGEHDGPAIALGGVGSGATPLEMAAAYGTFANAGQRVDPHLIERVSDRAGNDVYTRQAEPEQVVDPQVNAALVDIMRDVVSRGTGTAAQLPGGWDVAGKTGTSQNFYDAWFAGITPPLAAAVWVGHAEGQVAMPNMTGGSVPTQIWRAFMAAALDGREPRPFPDADVDFSDLAEGEQTDLSDVRGLQQDEAEELLSDEGFVAVVRAVASEAPEGQVVWQDPGPGSAAAGSDVVIGVSTGVPPGTEIPDVGGLDRAEAEQRLVSAGLEPVVHEVDHDAPEGSVVGQSPAPGERVPDDSPVGIDVSTGEPAGVEVPDVGGLDRAEAEQRLASAGFEPVVHEVHHDAPEGSVVGQSPAPGERVPDGSPVGIDVSIGPDEEGGDTSSEDDGAGDTSSEDDEAVDTNPETATAGADHDA